MSCYSFHMKKSFLSGRFVAASLMVFLAWWMGNTKPVPADDWFSKFMMVQGTTVTMHMMLIFSCFAGGTGFCEDYEYKYYRKIIQRKSISAYVLGEMGAGASTAFLSCLTGTLLYVLLLSFTMPSPDKYALQSIVEALCFGEEATAYYVMIAMFQCVLDAVLAAIVCCGTIAISAVVPHKFTALCMPMILYWIEITLAVYVLRLPPIFNWDGVFMLLTGGSENVTEFVGYLLFNIVLWTGFPMIIFWRKVKERYQNE